jgi:crotonobetainyl-CoA:carnitine CoA-transferase CaiB-like acyl-CoA transferase
MLTALHATTLTGAPGLCGSGDLSPTLSRTPSRLVSAAAECGAHTDAIRAEMGYGADEMAVLRARQVI